MRTFTLAFLSTQALFTLACMFGDNPFLSDKEAPETRSEAPTPTQVATPALPGQITPPAARGIDHEMMLMCWKDGQVINARECPSRIHQIGITPIKAGPIILPNSMATVTPLDPESNGEPCGEIRHIESPVKLPDIPISRSITLHDIKSEKYKARIAEATQAKATPIRVLARVDLDGNGSEEVLFEVNSNPGWHVEGPNEIISIVGVRAIVNGQVETLILHNTQETIPQGEQTHYWVRGDLTGLTDVEGDGRLEVVVSTGYYEGGGSTVYAFDGTQFTELGGFGCGA